MDFEKLLGEFEYHPSRATRAAVLEAFAGVVRERDEWRHEADTNRLRGESIMQLRSQVTAMKRQVAGLQKQVENEKEYGRQRRGHKIAEWKALVSQRDAAVSRARELLESLQRAHETWGASEALDREKAAAERDAALARCAELERERDAAREVARSRADAGDAAVAAKVELHQVRSALAAMTTSRDELRTALLAMMDERDKALRDLDTVTAQAAAMRAALEASHRELHRFEGCHLEVDAAIEAGRTALDDAPDAGRAYAERLRTAEAVCESVDADLRHRDAGLADRWKRWRDARMFSAPTPPAARPNSERDLDEICTTPPAAAAEVERLKQRLALALDTEEVLAGQLARAAEWVGSLYRGEWATNAERDQIIDGAARALGIATAAPAGEATPGPAICFCRKDVCECTDGEGK